MRLCLPRVLPLPFTAGGEITSVLYEFKYWALTILLPIR